MRAVAVRFLSTSGLALMLVVAGCGTDNDDPVPPGTSSSTTSTVPTTSAPSTTAAVSSSSTTGNEPDPDDAAARSFIDAWRSGDAETMQEIGEAEAVDAALSMGTATGEPDCTSQPNGQYQCVVNVSSGTRAYLLVGEPGASAGRIWWVAEYVPGT